MADPIVGEPILDRSGRVVVHDSTHDLFSLEPSDSGASVEWERSFDEISDTGSKLFVFGNDSLYEYNLTDSYNISSATYTQKFDFSAQDLSPESVHFGSNRTKLYMIGGSTDSVYAYNLSDPYNISSPSYSGESVSASGGSVLVQNPNALTFSANGEKFYAIDLNEGLASFTNE